MNAILKFRDNIINKIKTILTGEEGDALTGILFGSKAGLDDNTQTALFRSGIGHVMSVSGLHVVILSAVVMLILKRLSASKTMIFAAIEISCILLAICSGMAMSVLRALLMVTLSASAVIFKRRADVFNSLCLSVIILTMGNPFVIRDASFLLSVVGTYGIGVFAPYVTSGIKGESKTAGLMKNIIALLCVTVIILPVTIMYFSETSVVSPLANLLLIPLCNLALVCGIIVVITGGISIIAYPVLFIGGLCCKIVISVSEFAAKLEYAHIPLGYDFIKVSIVVLSIFVVFTYAIFKRRMYTVTSIMLSITILLGESIGFNVLQKDKLSIAILGKGTNATLVVSGNGSADIIDLSSADKNQDYVNTYLKSKGISHINNLFIVNSPYQNMTSFSKTMEFEKVDNVVLPTDTYVFDGVKICGKIPSFSDFNDVNIKYHNYTIKISDGGFVEIIFNKFDFKCYQKKSYGDAAVCVNYGNSIPQNVKCAYLVLLDKTDGYTENNSTFIGENNLLFEADNKGSINVRRLKSG
jgi:ComEC/Rec2-related protein